MLLAIQVLSEENVAKSKINGTNQQAEGGRNGLVEE